MQVTPSNKTAKTFDEQSWKQSDETSIVSATSTYDDISVCNSTTPSVVSSGGGPSTSIEIISSENVPSINRTEVRRSKSRVRSYLKKCKDVLIGTQQQNQQHQHQQQSDDTRPITHEPVSQNPSTSSWYLDDNEVVESKSINTEGICNTNVNQITVEVELNVDKNVNHENNNQNVVAVEIIETTATETDVVTDNRDETLDAVIEIGTVGDSQSSEVSRFFLFYFL